MKALEAALFCMISLGACSDRGAVDSDVERPATARPAGNDRIPLGGIGQMTAGAWQMTGVGRSKELVFANSSEAVFALSCYGGRGLIAERRGLIASVPINMMRLSVGTRTRNFAVNPISGGKPALRAILAADVDVAIQLRSEPAIITVDLGEGPALRLPPSEIVVALARSCSRP